MKVTQYPPVYGEETGQVGVLVGDSPQTGPLQPPGSPSPPYSKQVSTG